jgi:hypothetical protein
MIAQPGDHTVVDHLLWHPRFGDVAHYATPPDVASRACGRRRHPASWSLAGACQWATRCVELPGEPRAHILHR